MHVPCISFGALYLEHSANGSNPPSASVIPNSHLPHPNLSSSHQSGPSASLSHAAGQQPYQTAHVSNPAQATPNIVGAASVSNPSSATHTIGASRMPDTAHGQGQSQHQRLDPALLPSSGPRPPSPGRFRFSMTQCSKCLSSELPESLQSV